MLSVNDLDEVERWLRGELRPAVRGERNPGTAITRGLRSLVVGILGGENRHYEARSRTFRWMDLVVDLSFVYSSYLRLFGLS